MESDENVPRRVMKKYEGNSPYKRVAEAKRSRSLYVFRSIAVFKQRKTYESSNVRDRLLIASSGCAYFDTV